MACSEGGINVVYFQHPKTHDSTFGISDWPLSPSSASTYTAMDVPPPERVSVDVKMQRLNIEWADDHVSVFPLDALRQACPCAECQGNVIEHIKKPGFLHIFRQKNRWQNVKVEKAGSVGLRITWDDGHSGGIYRWDRLRELQPPE